MRRSLEETSDKSSRQHRDAGSVIGLLRNHIRLFLMVPGFTAGGSLSFYTFTTYMQKHLVNTLGMDPKKTASGLMTGALLVFMLLQPAIGALSDKIGHRTSMMIFGAGAAICTVPILPCCRMFRALALRSC